MSSILWKPVSQGMWNPGGTSFMLPDRPGGYAGVSVVDASGNVLERLQTKHTAGSGGAWKFFSTRPGASFGKNIFARVDLGNEIERYYSIPDASQRLGLNFSSEIPSESGDIKSADVLTAEGGARYDNPEGGGGYPAGYTPGQAGPYGFYPSNLENLFPDVTNVKYKKMKSAPYKFVDPMEFAKSFGQFNRSEIQKNFELSKQMSLEQLDTELKGLQNYVPAASALKRQETSLDNIFNQMQRTSQVRMALPGVEESLAAQNLRAETYARGGVPDEIANQALELGIRSSAADRATAGGFGATSSVARKVSDLMSATQRLQLAQYGEGLLGQNIQTKANLFLAPTEYSEAGTQVRVMPEVGAGRLSAQNLSELNQLTTISPTTALQSSIQQEQFSTSLEQQTRMFNTGNAFTAAQMNANAANQFALAKFQYQVGFAGSVAGAAQTNANTQAQMDLANKYFDIYKESKGDTQAANNIASIISGLGTVGAIASNIIRAFQPQEPSGTTTDGGVSVPGSEGGSGVGSTGENMPGTEIPQPSLPTSPGGGIEETGVPGAGEGTRVSIPFEPGVPSDYQTSAATMPTGGGAGAGVGQVYSTPLVSNFQSDTGIDVTRGGNADTTRALLSGSNVVLNQAGLATQAFPNSVSAGTNNFGQQLYSDKGLKNNTDTSVGKGIVSAIQRVIDPMGALSEEDTKAVSVLGDIASDTTLLTSLTNAYLNKDSKAFTNILLGAFKKPLLDELYKNPETARAGGGLDTALSSYNLFANWGVMSPAQKSLAIATTGIKGFYTATGENLFNATVIKPTFSESGKLITPGLNVGQGIQLLGLGVNTYSMIKNWNQMSDLSRLVSGSAEVSNMITTASSLGLLGKGVTGAQIATSAGEISSAGFSLAPSYGVGAITGPVGNNLPAGYQIVSAGGRGVIATPQGLEASARAFTEVSPGISESTGIVSSATSGSAAFAPGSVAGGGAPQIISGQFVSDAQAAAPGGSLAATNPLLSNVAGGLGVVGMGAGAYQVYKGWGQGGKSGLINGALGGTAIAAGAYALGSSAMMSGTMFASAAATGPYAPFVLAGMVAVSVLSNAIHTGKSEAQNERDAIREGMLRKSGLLDNNFNVTLADGTKVDAGIDGHGGLHDARNPDMLTEGGGKGRRLNAYEVDYTNDLDYAANMGTSSLMRLLAGTGSAKNVDQIGAQLGNAAISRIGFGADMTESNFNEMASNVRAMYAKSGITSKTDAYSLANQAYSEGRISDTQLVVMHQSFDMLFDKNGYAKANSLLSGRHNGVQVAAENATKAENGETPPKLVTNKPLVLGGLKEPYKPVSEEEARTIPIIPGLVGATPGRSGNQNTRTTANIVEALKFSPVKAKESPLLASQKSKMLTPRKRAELMNLNKTDARKRNRSVYGASLING